MDHQVEKDHIKNMLHSKSACSVKEDLYEEDVFVDDKVHVFPTVVTVNNVELKDDKWQSNNMRQFEMSISLDNIKTELSSSDLNWPMINDNIKMEEDTIDYNIKIEFDNGLLYCEDCHAYYKDYCINCGMLVHILNKNIVCGEDNEAPEQLPRDILEIQESFGQLRIFALKIIPERVKFGPFTGLGGSEYPLKIKDGKLIVNKAKSKYINWMQYINPARNISERNLLVLQCENNIYYQTTRQILKGDELLVYFGEDSEDSLNNDSEMDFIPSVEHILRDTFACTFCCLGFSSKSYLERHKTTCPARMAEDHSMRELMQCPSCKIHLARNEYVHHHVAYCWKRECDLPTSGNRAARANKRKTRLQQIYKCQQCKYSTRYKGNLKRQADRHYEVKTYKCGLCNRRFKTNSSLRLHEANTHAHVKVEEDPERSIDHHKKPQVKTEEALWPPVDVKQFKCSQCEFRAKYRQNLKRHITRKHLKVYNYKCGTCGYQTITAWDLKVHTKTKHLKEFDYKCESCEYRTNIKYRLERHVKIVHLREFDHKCALCEYQTTWKKRLELHVQMRHRRKFDLSCDLCDYKTNKSHLLKRHTGTKHLQQFTYKCQLCAYKTRDPSHLGVHVKSKHLGEFNYECHSCTFKTNVKSKLETHIKTKHLKEFNYKCALCEYRTNLKYRLENHVKSKHLKEFDYKCPSCAFETNCKSYLERHIKAMHFGEYSYMCRWCSFGTNVKSTLENHTKSRHLEKFDYKCKACGYETNNKERLKKHIKTIHLKQFDYKCSACTFGTNTKAILDRHVQSKHLNNFDYKCDLCQYKTNSKDHFELHIKAIHLKQYD